MDRKEYEFFHNLCFKLNIATDDFKLKFYKLKIIKNINRLCFVIIILYQNKVLSNKSLTLNGTKSETKLNIIT